MNKFGDKLMTYLEELTKDEIRNRVWDEVSIQVRWQVWDPQIFIDILNFRDYNVTSRFFIDTRLNKS